MVADSGLPGSWTRPVVYGLPSFEAILRVALDEIVVAAATPPKICRRATPAPGICSSALLSWSWTRLTRGVKTEVARPAR